MIPFLSLESQMENDLQGRLQSFTIPDILTFLNMSQKTGTLRLLNNSREAHIYFESGAVKFASSSQEKFRLGSILLQRKKIDGSQQKMIEKMMLEQKGRFGKIAVEEKILTEQELRDYLKIQVSEILYDCFVWAGGTFAFTGGMQLPE